MISKKLSELNLNRQKISNFLLYLFVFSLPWQTVFLLREKFIAGEKFQYTTIGVYFFEIVLLVWLLSIFKFSKLKPLKLFSDFKKLINPNKLNILFTLFILWSFLSIFWASNKLLALSFFIKLLLGISLFFAISSEKIRKNLNLKKVFFIFLLSATLQSGLGIWQFTNQETFSNKWLGLNSHIVWQGGTSVLQNENGRWLRAYGGLPHPNILAGYLLVALFFGFYLYTKTNKRNFYQKTFLLSSIIIIFLTSLATFSRSAYLAFFIGLFFLVAYFISHKKQSFLYKLFPLFLIIIIIGIFFITTYSNLFLLRANTNSRLEQKSFNDRSLYILEAEKQISQHPFIGVGLGNYTSTIYKKDVFKKQIWQYQPVHNTFILILAELGLIGIILFVGIIIQLLWKISSFFKKPFQEKDINKIFFFIALISLLTLFVFDHWLWTTDFGVLLFWLIAGLSFTDYNKK